VECVVPNALPNQCSFAVKFSRLRRSPQHHLAFSEHLESSSEKPIHHCAKRERRYPYSHCM
jgi:hypothetical protein